MANSIFLALIFWLISSKANGQTSRCFDAIPLLIGCPTGTRPADSTYSVKFFYNKTLDDCQLVFHITLLNEKTSCMSRTSNLFNSVEACSRECKMAHNSNPATLNFPFYLPSMQQISLQRPADTRRLIYTTTTMPPPRSSWNQANWLLNYPVFVRPGVVTTPPSIFEPMKTNHEVRPVGQRHIRCLYPMNMYTENMKGCRTFYPIYTFDTQLKRCVPVVYGVCSMSTRNYLGNRFETMEECRRLCLFNTDPSLVENRKIHSSLIFPHQNVLPQTTTPNNNWIPFFPTIGPTALPPPRRSYPNNGMSLNLYPYSFMTTTQSWMSQPNLKRYSKNARCNSATYLDVYGNKTDCKDHSPGYMYEYSVNAGKCQHFYYTGCRKVIINFFPNLLSCQRSCEKWDDDDQEPCPARCPNNPCKTTSCQKFPQAECRPDQCSGCNARFFIKNKEVDCRVHSILTMTTPNTPMLLNPYVYRTSDETPSLMTPYQYRPLNNFKFRLKKTQNPLNEIKELNYSQPVVTKLRPKLTADVGKFIIFFNNDNEF